MATIKITYTKPISTEWETVVWEVDDSKANQVQRFLRELLGPARRTE